MSTITTHITLPAEVSLDADGGIQVRSLGFFNSLLAVINTEFILQNDMFSEDVAGIYERDSERCTDILINLLGERYEVDRERLLKVVTRVCTPGPPWKPQETHILLGVRGQ